MSKQAVKRFSMRPLRLDDAEIVADWLRQVEDLSLFDRTMAVPPAAEALRDSWKADLAPSRTPAAYWFIVENDASQAVALGGLQSVNYIHGDAVLPILVARPARGNGLGLAIATALLDIAFDRLRLRRVTTFFRADNVRSERLTRRAGFREEGRMREAWFAEGRHLDCIMVGLLREEWYSRREVLTPELAGEVVVLLGRSEADAPSSPLARPAPLKMR